MGLDKRSTEVSRLNQSRRSLIELRLAVLEAQQRYYTLVVSIDRLTA